MNLHRPSPALIVATLALVVALFGSGLAQAAGQITTRQLANNAVISSKVKDATLKGADVRDASLTGADLKTGSVTGDDLADGSVGTGEVADGAITTGDVLDGNLTGDDLTNGSVGPDEIAGDSLTSAQLATGGIEGGDLATETVPLSKLAPDAVTHGYYDAEFGNQLIETTSLSVISVDLPAGRYVVTASALLININGNNLSAFCRLHDGTSALVEHRVIDASTERSHSVLVTGVVTLAAPATVALQCRSTLGNTLFTAAQSYPSITAISAGTVASQASRAAGTRNPRTGATP